MIEQITSWTKHIPFTKYIPVAFVLLWATGFIGARYAMPYAEPFAFLSLRFVATLIILGLFLLFTKAKWPNKTSTFYALLTGAFIHTIYLGSVFWAIKKGLPAGYAGIIVGLQPIITAILAVQIIGDRIAKTQIFGLIIGLIGVSMVILPNIPANENTNIIFNAFVVFAGVVFFSLGAILQKKHANSETLISTIWLQYLGALALSLPIALMFETFAFEWNGELIFAFIWLVLVLSIGAILLLMVMIKAGEATKVASYFYLVPAITAILAFILFGENLNLVQLVGMLITTIGVALATVLVKKQHNQ